ncbi:reverse transcriptase family protein [Convivina intestini]|uniref:RNA-directed DNA polymerase n=1 Tax=Convivina intestini TaxID=1505726 RepID=A0A2U1D5L6_9LACO|nr:reverse transcriptase family protein [Convivina intestini]PVY82832.1 reverse transcriptase (RNA-dependent DNA polymerase) [Convivina intestini]CAH1856831.1 hypothetical protein R077811_01348 [Convivina intestini]SDC19617.1 Reverse transcriptase (RNA-dependent DNA polymerase) [Leuconostocaceae bacterium R-53105]
MKKDFTNISTYQEFIEYIKSFSEYQYLTRTLSKDFLQRINETQNMGDFYTTKMISKKAGGNRELAIPIEELKHLQKALLGVLKKYQRLSIRKSKWSSNYDYISPAFKSIKIGSHNKFYVNKLDLKNRHTKGIPSHVVHASHHTNKKLVITFDFENFFTTIRPNRIRGIFKGYFKFSDFVCTLLTSITTHFKVGLPQGAPTSPYLSNLATYEFDKAFHKECKKLGIYYSRYADDVALSTNNYSVLYNNSIFSEKPKNGKRLQFCDYLNNLLEQNHLTIKGSKTRVMSYWNRQVVTGIVVNKKISIGKDELVRARSVLINIGKTLTILDYRMGIIAVDKQIKKFYDEYQLRNSHEEELQTIRDDNERSLCMLCIALLTIHSLIEYYSQVMPTNSKLIKIKELYNSIQYNLFYNKNYRHIIIKNNHLFKFNLHSFPIFLIEKLNFQSH